MKRMFCLPVIIIAVVLCGASSGYTPDGFGQYTTGGEGGTVVTVSTATGLQTYAETIDVPYIIQVSGTIDLSSIGGKVNIRSNKTIKGIDASATIIGEVGFKNDSSNVIIERLSITNPDDYGEGDGISIKEDITNVFVTKCTLYDCNDGCLDITRRSDYITISWCKFYFTTGENPRVSLVGGGDTHDDDGTLHITFHHNWFSSGCWQRIPSVRFGRVHLYNNYYNSPGNLYCVRSRIQAECLIENNYFKNVNDPYYIYIDDEPPEEYGKIGASGNILVGCSGRVDDGDDDVFVPPYSYTLADAEDIPVIVEYGAGADGIDGYPYHWLFGLYGDFDYSDLVDGNDLGSFVDYWLDTNDVTDINDADYNGDGVVNSYEYALFAGNYLKVPPDITAPDAPEDLWALGGNATVSLDWDNNNEPDFNGYNVYRSISSGSDYAKINDSLLIDSSYSDETVSNGTMYYYVVRAVDTSENESGNSAEACAVPDSNDDSVTIQENATGFCSLDGDVETEEHPGYTGYGYANTDNESGTGIDWSINTASAGEYNFKWRYANGSSDRPARLLINGYEEASSISFPGTGAWENWSEVSVVMTLTTGVKEVRLEATGSSGCANIDYLVISGPTPEAAVCP